MSETVSTAWGEIISDLVCFFKTYLDYDDLQDANRMTESRMAGHFRPAVKMMEHPDNIFGMYLYKFGISMAYFIKICDILGCND